jgi:hypothetical protein
VREAFTQSDPSWGERWCLSYGDVLYGSAWRGDRIENDGVRRQVRERLEAAMASVGNVGKRLFVEHLLPGSTPETLRDLVVRARRTANVGTDTLVVLLVDPIQRLYAGPMGHLEGRALENLNANEVERVGMVAQQLKAMADDPTLNMAGIFTSDTTKAAIASGASSSTSLRGSYQLNHLATSIFGLHAADDLKTLGERLKEGKILDNDGAHFEAWASRRYPEDMLHRRDAEQLGAKVAFLECSGNRAGPAHSMIFGFVPGAMAFLERENLDLSERGPRAGSPIESKKYAGKPRARKAQP